MNNFKIDPNEFLFTEIQAYYNSDYQGGEGKWNVKGTIEYIICTLKNDINYPVADDKLKDAASGLYDILKRDLSSIQQLSGVNNLTVCVVPRAKVKYMPEQLFFKRTIKDAVEKIDGLNDGTNYINRIEDTKTTHRPPPYEGNGSQPYPNITKDTCLISDDIIGKDILLIDDLYTKTVNIDEDAIQALLDRGANSVIFYSIGKTI